MIKTHVFLTSNTDANTDADAAHNPFMTRGDAAAQLLKRLLPAATGYVQSRALDADAIYAGVAEFWFSDHQSATSLTNDLERLAPLWRDNISVSSVITGMERTVIRLPAHHSVRTTKGVFPFRRKQGMSVGDFQHHWWLRHGPIAALTENALCYTQTHVLPEFYDAATPDYDGVTELSWANRALADAAMDSRQMREDQANDADNFVDKDSIGLFFVESDVVMAP